jgi:hypothetical protein
MKGLCQEESSYKEVRHEEGSALSPLEKGGGQRGEWETLEEGSP